MNEKDFEATVYAFSNLHQTSETTMVCSMVLNLLNIGLNNEDMTKQQLLEMFLYKPYSDWDKQMPLNKWSGITNGSLTIIHNDVDGNILYLSNIPAFVHNFTVYGCRFTSFISTTILPYTLKLLDLSYGNMKGIFNIEEFPFLEKLDLSGNTFDGKIDFTKLPSSMTYFNILSNQFSGLVDLTKLPPSIIYFNIAHNQFSGLVDLTNLPSSIKLFNIAHNKFNSINLTNLPLSIDYFNITDNLFSGSINLTNLPPSIKYCNMDILGCSIHVIDLSSYITHSNISHDQFSGLIDLTKSHIYIIKYVI